MALVGRLPPAVDRQRSPANAEYPWTNGVALTIPCEHSYPILQSFAPPIWQLFTQTLEDASAELAA